MSTVPIRVEVNCRPASVDQLQHPALVNYGHLTAMQVRNRCARGLQRHLSRLEAATRELFDTGLDADRVRDCVRHALADTSDASVRVSVFWPETDDSASIMVAVRAPAEPVTTAQRLESVRYQRPVAHIKHVGGFAQIYFGRRAERRGFDDALLTGPDGVISESTISNIAFYDGSAVVWPTAPCLLGITMQLLEPRLAGTGLPTRRAPIRLADLPSFSAAILTNSIGVVPVGRIDDTSLRVDPGLMAKLADVYESIPWDPI